MKRAKKIPCDHHKRGARWSGMRCGHSTGQDRFD